MTEINSMDVRLADESPLYHVYLIPSIEGVVKPGQVRAAKARIALIKAENPELVARCQGQTEQRALQILAELAW